jgi:predicted small lipoprotein YifL
VKKIITAALTILLVFVIAACGSGDDISPPDNNGPADDIDIIIDTLQDDEGYQVSIWQ